MNGAEFSGDGAQFGTPGVLPTAAPPFIWVVVFTSVVAWWLWPWLTLLSQKSHPSPQKPYPQTLKNVDAKTKIPESSMSELGASPEKITKSIEETAAFEEVVLSDALGFEPRAVFEETFALTADHIHGALSGPPSGDKYLESVASFHRLSQILDRIFTNWGSDECAKFSRLRENSEKFKTAFGEWTEGPQRKTHDLLALAGFKRQIADDESAWIFNPEDAHARLKAFTVKLCLSKLEDQQRARGARRWASEDNSSVVPQLENSKLSDLLAIYRASVVPQMPAAFGGTPTPLSARERHVEIAVRVQLNTRRSEVNAGPLPVHEGLVAVARAIAHGQRSRARSNDNVKVIHQGPAIGALPGNSKKLAAEVRELLASLAFPPGFVLGHLHFSSDELPRIFGLTSATGKQHDKDSTDEAADRIASEALGHWSARQNHDIVWLSAAICGVGAALDYTMNRGFVTLLLVGFEGEIPSPPAKAKRHQDALAEGPTKASPKPTQWGRMSFGARVHTMDSGQKPMNLNRKGG